MRIAALMACFNRRELTLRCLSSVHQGAAGHDVTVYLLDDASTDGTAAAVRDAFPGTVIIAGDGKHFWNGGMYRAWETARASRYDAYLLLNDDVEFDADFLARMTAPPAPRQAGL
jgi:GT2 family glycosyltransferase